MHQAVDAQQEVLREPAPLVLFEDFGDNALVFEMIFWCESSGERGLREIRSDIRFRIDELFNANGIVISFPQRDVHLYSHTPIEVTLKQPPTTPAKREPGT